MKLRKMVLNINGVDRIFMSIPRMTACLMFCAG